MLAAFEVSNSATRNVLASLGVQVLLAVVCAMLTDGGQAAQMVVYAAAINACMTLWILIRRAKCPTRGDLFALRFGFLLLIPPIALAMSVAWIARGLR
jgi:hypothetical protein